jgi:Cu2+-exporting ATPase
MAGVLSAGASSIGIAPAAAGRTDEAQVHATLTVADMVCGTCITSVEDALTATPGVVTARANLGARRVAVTYDNERTDITKLVEALGKAGYRAAEIDPAAPDGRDNDLLHRLGVAGFAAANIMLLSVSVWSGAASDMDHSVQSLFHWISALIGLPAIAYAGQPFFRSAAAALRGRRLNMDVPISLGIILATAMSLFQTIRGTEQVYFDAAVTLAFFLLIGRVLDERMRVRARGAAENLLGLKALSAQVVGADGAVKVVPARQLAPGMIVLVAAGERIAADGIVREGISEIDESLITGETVPRPVRSGDRVHAGTVNNGAPLRVEATSTQENTLLAEIARTMQAAEQNRGHYVRLADRAARLYAPAVHMLGLGTFIGWMLLGAGWEAALTCAIAVLIITCPCALALAVPAVQVAATSRLFADGVIVKAADGLERLAEVDTVVFDKTGTLTLGEPQLVNGDKVAPDVLERAAALAVVSRHPYSRALVRAATARGLTVRAASGVREVPGSGLIAMTSAGEERLGRAAFVGLARDDAQAQTLWYGAPGLEAVGFAFEDAPKADAIPVVSQLATAGYHVELLSGDRPEVTAREARAAGIAVWRGGMQPNDKLARLEELARQGRKVLMVGDGLNDAPALAAGHASLSPATAADISQTAADAVFQGERLVPVVNAIAVSRAAHRMALQNFGLALAYNVVFVPLAVAGHVTPLLAAVAMSGSSIAVTVNALRLRTMRLTLPVLAKGKAHP